MVWYSFEALKLMYVTGEGGLLFGRMRFFSICTLVGCGILAPLNFNDTYLKDHPSEKNGSLDKLTILNISQGSSR